ncbi:MAG: hypothetical protein UT56_C0003G0041 [Candidatus Levybacteria bacterium GW2011_GWB1_39_7]|nr:MAG: hypothetical protein UT56_C0003G0041 [Candidatus Levybacteria bacterium GW2011_GWB1_39_7]OGH47492.1 MAG: hypothetical protein A3G66_04080 [Candidatus Levybacteria bacterium RIFCSPLOWO2_12_FULL_39_17]
MQSIFGFYYVVGLLGHMGWPRRRGLFSSEAVIDSLILDSTIDQMIDWSASIGACRPNIALQIIASMFRDMDWDSKEALDIDTEISNLKKQWVERGNNSNPREAVKPVKFSKTSKVISMKQLKHKDIQHALEVYCYESLFWGLVNSDGFRTYYSTNEKRQREQMPEYKKAGLAVDYIPTLDQILKEGEEILKGYEKEVRPLSPIPQKLIDDALSLGIKVN